MRMLLVPWRQPYDVGEGKKARGGLDERIHAIPHIECRDEHFCRYVLAENDDRSEGGNECCPIDADRYLALP